MPRLLGSEIDLSSCCGITLVVELATKVLCYDYLQ